MMFTHRNFAITKQNHAQLGGLNLVCENCQHKLKEHIDLACPVDQAAEVQDFLKRAEDWPKLIDAEPDRTMPGKYIDMTVFRDRLLVLTDVGLYWMCSDKLELVPVK